MTELSPTALRAALADAGEVHGGRAHVGRPHDPTPVLSCQAVARAIISNGVSCFAS